MTKDLSHITRRVGKIAFPVLSARKADSEAGSDSTALCVGSSTTNPALVEAALMLSTGPTAICD